MPYPHNTIIVLDQEEVEDGGEDPPTGSSPPLGSSCLQPCCPRFVNSELYFLDWGYLSHFRDSQESACQMWKGKILQKKHFLVYKY